MQPHCLRNPAHLFSYFAEAELSTALGNIAKARATSLTTAAAEPTKNCHLLSPSKFAAR